VIRRLFRAAGAALLLGLLAACGEADRAGEGFDDFWSEFRTSVSTDDAAAVRGLTRFPFLFEGEARDSSSFADVYAALFDEAARSCLAAAAPTLEDGRYVAFCGPTSYYFARDERGWHFAEFGADGEAVDAGTPNPVGALGSWRLAGGRVAPWAPDRDVPFTHAELAGTSLEIGLGEVLADPPLGCANAENELLVSPAEGLFQGNLPEPSDAAARRLGIDRLPVLTLRVSCDSGVFDYHQTPGDTLWLGLDNVVWKLTPEGIGYTPAAAVRVLLAEHMTGDMGFTPESIAPKRGFLSPTLTDSIAAYFARPSRADEPPPIDGDPFTNTQEYPDRFTLEVVEANGERATVRVVFSDGTRPRAADYLLVREAPRWLLDDIRYEDGVTFRELLRP
jgi:hypothetical protein